jgi:hypothetical protein
MAGNFERRLSKQVEALDERPPIVHVMAAFTALLTLPLFADVIHQFRHQPQADPENVNAISTAFAALGPIFHTVTLIPLAAALLAVAFFTWTQRPWAWTVNLVIVGITVVVMFTNFHLQLPMFLWLILTGTLAYFWTRPRTKAWYGLH